MRYLIINRLASSCILQLQRIYRQSGINQINEFHKWIGLKRSTCTFTHINIAQMQHWNCRIWTLRDLRIAAYSIWLDKFEGRMRKVLSFAYMIVRTLEFSNLNKSINTITKRARIGFTRAKPTACLTTCTVIVSPYVNQVKPFEVLFFYSCYSIRANTSCLNGPSFVVSFGGINYFTLLNIFNVNHWLFDTPWKQLSLDKLTMIHGSIQRTTKNWLACIK